MNLKKGLEMCEHLGREEYLQVNQMLGEHLWQKEVIPTVGDIAEFIRTGHNSQMQMIFDFFNNEKDFLDMAHRQGASYDEGESAAFIQSVMSSNNTDISKAGYFYKLLMASADDFTIVSKSCDSEGVRMRLSEINQELYDYRIRYNWVNELKSHVRMKFDEFVQICGEKELEQVHVRSPLSCASFPHTAEDARVAGKMRGICKRCAGALPGGVHNVGVFTALMVTEHATQSALNSMNKGRKKDVNDTLTGGYSGGYNWESISAWINELVEDLKGDKVSSRFYEIALMSRIRFDEEGPFVASLVGSINRSGNLFGAYIFAPTNRAFEKILNAGQFEDRSLKLQIAMNQYSVEEGKGP
jgi:hypothetical protein